MSRVARLMGPYLPAISRSIIRHFGPKKSAQTQVWQKGSVFFNTHDLSGGAAKVARALFNAQKEVEPAHFFVKHKKTEDPNIHPVPEFEKIPARLRFYLKQAAEKEGWLDYDALNPLGLLNHEHFAAADLVHFHNLHGAYFSYELLPVLSRGKSAVWTIHDMHPLTGHCGFSMECEAWKTGCGNCPDLNIYPSIKKDRTAYLHQRKKALIQQANPVLVSPSIWLAKRLQRAFPKLRVKTIPNGVNTRVFCPGSKEAARTELKLPKDDFLLVYASELATQNPYKGGEVVRELIGSELPPNTKIITIGGKESKGSEQHLPYGYIASEQEMAKLFQAADLMVYPTKADNHPLVVMEALATGLPVLATAEAGIPEIIEDGVQGWLMPRATGAAPFLQRIQEMATQPQSRWTEAQNAARKHAEENFTLQAMIQAYQKLYSSLRTESHE